MSFSQAQQLCARKAHAFVCAEKHKQEAERFAASSRRLRHLAGPSACLENTGCIFQLLQHTKNAKSNEILHFSMSSDEEELEKHHQIKFTGWVLSILVGL